jgi:8-hydroxy-5-deazaflavin:NADPH oxidoreductase
MNVGIVGSGNVGQALSRLLSSTGHQVRVGSRSPLSSRATVSVADAVDHGECVVLAVPFTALSQLLPSLAQELQSKIVIDPTNPLNPDWSPLLLGQENSAGEEVGRMLPASRVVKAFNTVFADVMTKQRLARSGLAATTFVASNDAEAADLVCSLAQSAGFAPVKVGGLSASRHLEAMAHLNIGIAVGQKGGTNAAFVYHQAA